MSNPVGIDTAHLNVLVAGLGNPILGDDGVGWRVVEFAQEIYEKEQKSVNEAVRVNFECFSLGGISLMEQMIGYQIVILVDAISLKNQPVGHISVLSPDELPDIAAGYMNASHDTTFVQALKMGNMLGARLPDKIVIIGIECDPNFVFSEKLSAPVEAAIPKAAEEIMEQLKKIEKDYIENEKE